MVYYTQTLRKDTLMGLFSSLAPPDINIGAEDWSKIPGAVLLDVRTEQEFAEGHIPGATNIPLRELVKARKTRERFKDLQTPFFVYCLTSARSRHAVSALRQMGYEKSYIIGGIKDYKGELEK